MDDIKYSRQKIYMRLLIVFFVIMIVLTILSRVADSITIAKVTTEKAKRGTIDYNVMVDGIVEPSEKVNIKIDEGFIVDKINVADGESIHIGDILILLDSKDLKDKLFDAEIALQVLGLKLRQLKLEKYEENDEFVVKMAKIELERAQSDYDVSKSINYGKEVLEDKRRLEDAKLKLEEAEIENEKKKEDNKKAIENNEISIKSTELEISQKNQEIKKLKETVNKGNVVVSNQNGIVDKVSSKEGEMTTGSIAISIISDDAISVFRAEADSEETQYIKVGDSVKITEKGKTIPIEGAVVKSINISPDDENIAQIVVAMPEDKVLTPGTRASLTHKYKTEEFEKIVPISAIRSSQTDNYVLVIRESQTVMGSELVAVRVNVKVGDKNNSNAVILEGLGNDDVIITSSNKPIGGGDRVRYSE